MKYVAPAELIAKLRKTDTPYFGFFRVSVVLSLILLTFAWLIALMHFRDAVEPDVFYHHLLVSLVLTNGLGLLIIGHGVWAARRIQTHHDRIVAACHNLTEGVYHSKLYLGDYPEMQELESAFNDMVDVMWHRINRVTPGGAA